MINISNIEWMVYLVTRDGEENIPTGKHIGNIMCSEAIAVKLLEKIPYLSLTALGPKND